MNFLIGILALILGLAVCFSGLRLFFIMLPIWGFIAGFFTGAAVIAAIAGNGFLATTLGVIAGLIAGIVFSAIAYLYWYFGVILAAAYAGGIFAASLFASLGVSAGWLLVIIGLAAGVIVAWAALVLAYPIYLVIFSTALAGSAIAIGGLLLMLGRFYRDQIGTGALWTKIGDHWALWLLWAVLAAIGVGAQLTKRTAAILPEERWSRVPSNAAR